jgi:hypothetical protein
VDSSVGQPQTEKSFPENPYRSPEAVSVESPGPGGMEATKFAQVGRVVVTWEKLRVVYNAIGIIPTVLIAIFVRHFLVGLVECVVLANLCFCFGPLIDGYLTWFGFRHKAVTIVLFVLGTCIMLLLSLGAALVSSLRF